MSAELPVVEGFNAQTIPDQIEAAIHLVPQGNGEHTDESTYGLGHAPFHNRGENDFRIGMAIELVTSCQKISAQFGKIINLAVVGNHEAAVVGGHWLRPSRREVDDSEAPEAQSNAGTGSNPLTIGIGTPVAQPFGHGPDLAV